MDRAVDITSCANESWKNIKIPLSIIKKKVGTGAFLMRKHITCVTKESNKHKS